MDRTYNIVDHSVRHRKTKSPSIFLRIFEAASQKSRLLMHAMHIICWLLDRQNGLKTILAHLIWCITIFRTIWMLLLSHLSWWFRFFSCFVRLFFAVDLLIRVGLLLFFICVALSHISLISFLSSLLYSSSRKSLPAYVTHRTHSTQRNARLSFNKPLWSHATSSPKPSRCHNIFIVINFLYSHQSTSFTLYLFIAEPR